MNLGIFNKVATKKFALDSVRSGSNLFNVEEFMGDEIWNNQMAKRYKQARINPQFANKIEKYKRSSNGQEPLKAQIKAKTLKEP